MGKLRPMLMWLKLNHINADTRFHTLPKAELYRRNFALKELSEGKEGEMATDYHAFRFEDTKH